MLRSLLREDTARAHRALEGASLMRALATGEISVAGFGDYLQRQHRLHRPLEAALRAWLPADWSAQRLRKADWLQADLRHLGLGADGGADPLPTVASPAQALGVLYVLEGSTIGLQVVRKRLPPSHPGAGVAGRFLDGYGARTGLHWRQFVEALDAAPEAGWPQALKAAQATFDAFLQVFSEPGHDRPRRH